MRVSSKKLHSQNTEHSKDSNSDTDRVHHGTGSGKQSGYDDANTLGARDNAKRPERAENTEDSQDAEHGQVGAAACSVRQHCVDDADGDDEAIELVPAS